MCQASLSLPAWTLLRSPLLRGAALVGCTSVLLSATLVAEPTPQRDWVPAGAPSIDELAPAPQPPPLGTAPDWVDLTQRPRILLMGYWPPSNECIRHFSPNPEQNPEGWVGSDWEGRGYDVYAFFPEFPNPDCTNCGQGNGDLEVDYQDTSEDFWRIADLIQPAAIITLSRGAEDLSWEVEMNQINRLNWFHDFEPPRQPTPRPPDASVETGFRRTSTLPVVEIVDAVDAAGLGLNPFVCFTGHGGRFLSEFLAYHGVWYQDLHRSPSDTAWSLAAGHIHIGSLMSWDTAKAALEASLRVVIDTIDPVRAQRVCQSGAAPGDPGAARLRVCGDALVPGGATDLGLIGTPPDAPAWLVVGPEDDGLSVFGGLLLPYPYDAIYPFTADDRGRVFVEDIAHPGSAGTLFAQFVYADPEASFGFAFSNALALEFLP